MTEAAKFTPGRSIEQSAAKYAAMMKSDPAAADLYAEVHNTDPADYLYPDSSDRDEARLCDEVSDNKSNRVMRKFLADVEALVCRDRQEFYDVPELNHGRTARIATESLGTPLTAEQVCQFNLSQKLSRCAHKLTYDSLLDIAGYAANCAAVMASRLPVNGT